MKDMKRLGLGMAMLLLLVGLISACAGIRADDAVRAEVRDTKIAKVGDTVHLFYGMSKTAKEEFCPNAIVPVFRYAKGYPIDASKIEVGKIKVVKDLGEHFIEAIVVDGTMREGDIAMLSHSSCMITMPQS